VSSGSLALTARATPSAYVGQALTIQPNPAPEMHAHEYPPTMLDGVPLVAAIACVVVYEKFRYVRRRPTR
jgi:hypothetical protein